MSLRFLTRFLVAIFGEGDGREENGCRYGKEDWSGVFHTQMKHRSGGKVSGAAESLFRFVRIGITGGDRRNRETERADPLRIRPQCDPRLGKRGPYLGLLFEGSDDRVAHFCGVGAGRALAKDVAGTVATVD